MFPVFQVCLSAKETWYSANVINDGDFSPKPLSEIFSSTIAPPPFSTKNPIVVLSPSSQSQGISTASISSNYNSNAVMSYSTSTPPPEQFVSTTPSSPTQSTLFETQSTFSLPTQPNMPESRPFPYQILEQPNGLPVIQEMQKPPGPPNFFVVYQQAPQILENYPSGLQQNYVSPQTTLSTLQPEISTHQSTFSTFRPEISSIEFSAANKELSMPQFPVSTMRPEISTMSSTFSTLRPDTSGFTVSDSSQFTSSGTTFSTPEPSRTTLTSVPPSTRTPSTLGPSTFWTTVSPNPTISTRRTPCINGTGKFPLGPTFPTLRIRMVAPSGSITNIHLNQPTTSTPKWTKSTRKPTTARTFKTKRTSNSYDRCLNSCSGRKTRICAAPLAKIPIDPNTLKGFPSICHMACYNSFKKIRKYYLGFFTNQDFPA